MNNSISPDINTKNSKNNSNVNTTVNIKIKRNNYNIKTEKNNDNIKEEKKNNNIKNGKKNINSVQDNHMKIIKQEEKLIDNPKDQENNDEENEDGCFLTQMIKKDHNS